MPLPIPATPLEVITDAKTDVQKELLNSNPFLPNSFASALIVGFSNRLFDNYQSISDVLNASFYDTSPEEFLLRQAAWYNIYQLPESQATGVVVFTGVDGTVIPLGQECLSTNGVVAVTDSIATIATSTPAVTSITPSGFTATVTMASEHNLVNNILVTISGVDDVTQGDAYNVTSAAINVTGSNTFTYQMNLATGDFASGAIVVSWSSAVVSATTSTFGADSNLQSLEQLSMSPLVSGANATCSVSFASFVNGADLESIEDLRARFLYRVANPVANFNVSAIEQKCFEISGVTRVFVEEVTPALGQVTIYFMRDNDDVTPIPSAGEITTVKDNILTIKPANTSDNDVFVTALTPVSANFNFTSITPSTSTMKDSIEQQLGEFFATSPTPHSPVSADAYKTAIFNTIDSTTGEQLQGFDLSTPIGTINVVSGEIAILGTVVFA